MQPVTLDPTSYRPVQAENPFLTEAPTVGKNEFLQLLVTQLENQNPLEPAKDTEFVAQLATFSSLEQLVDLNQRMDAVVASQTDMVNSQALNLIGKHVLADTDGELQLEGGVAQSIVYELPEAVSSARVEIVDGGGNVVATIVPEDGEVAGSHTVTWDGKNTDGELLEDGTFTARVVVSDGTKETTGRPFVEVPVEGIRFGADGLALVSSDRTIPFDSIIEIRSE